jgi:hypothetical protein
LAEERHLRLAVGATDRVDGFPPRWIEAPPAAGEVGPPWEVAAGVQHRFEDAEAAVIEAEKCNEVEQRFGPRRHLLKQPRGHSGGQLGETIGSVD